MTTEPKDTGGSAFPSHGTMGEVAQEGMSIRDYFACAALQGMMATTAGPGFAQWDYYSEAAYKIADAMLKERNKP